VVQIVTRVSAVMLAFIPTLKSINILFYQYQIAIYYFVANHRSQRPIALIADPFCNTESCDSSWLGDDDVDWTALVHAVVEQILWHLGGFSTSSWSLDNHDWVRFHFSDDLIWTHNY
jgi:hypothetical protein